MERTDYSRLGFTRVAAVSTPFRLGEPLHNAKIIFNVLKSAAKDQVKVVCFPELSLTGYTCEDFHHNEEHLAQVRLALQWLVTETKSLDLCFIVGAPFQTSDGRLYNTGFVIAKGQVLGAVPKTHLPNYKEFYEKRWFVSGKGVNTLIQDPELGTFRFSPKQLFQVGNFIFGVEICEDFFAPLKPSTYHALAGANAVFNLSASNDLIGKAEWRVDKARVHSGDLGIAYIYASSGPWESSKDAVFGGQLIIAENGSVLGHSRKFSFEGDILVADIDGSLLSHERRVNGTFSSEPVPDGYGLPKPSSVSPALHSLLREYPKTPFVPDSSETVNQRAEEIFQILATGLARRWQTTNSEHLVLGLSGGLDSTLALLVCLETAKVLSKKPKQIVCITMPGLGTTDQTKKSAENLAKLSGVKFETRSIVKAVEQHFKDIDHDPKKEDVAFENAQARERTQILFDRANEADIRGIVVGTGDMSELWLGWCTYNGDQMSSYGVNCSIPKTLVKYLVGWYATHRASNDLKEVLSRVIETPISPELTRPGKKGAITQKTEDVIGPYLLHDFFLYFHLRHGFGPRKLFEISKLAFKNEFGVRDLKKWLEVFFRRGYANQFKRTAVPGGPKVGSVSLSPRADLRLPDEMVPAWIFDELKSI